MRIRLLIPLALAGLVARAGEPVRYDGYDPDRPTTRLPSWDQPYYAYGALDKPLQVDLSAELLARPTATWLKARKIGSLYYQSPEGEISQVHPRQRGGLGLKDLPPMALAAINDVLSRERPGAEADLLVRERAFRRVPVSVTWEVDGTLTVMVGREQRIEVQTPLSEAEVEQRWGIRLEAEGSATWSARDLALVDRAWQQLSPEARACVSDVPLYVTDKPAPSSGNSIMAAAYQYSMLEQPHIVMYSSALDGAETTFLGSALDPIPFDVHLVIHELAHAVGDARDRRAWVPLLEPMAALYEAQNRMKAAVNPGKDGRYHLGPEHKDIEQALDAARSRLVAVGWEPERHEDRWKERTAPSPVEQRWEEQMGLRWRPTRYGADDTIEGFADFFALVHTDREAMQRMAPDMVQWFDQEGVLDCGPPAP